MNNLQKWMVVPYDKNYTRNTNSTNQVLLNNSLPSDMKIKIYNELLTRLMLKKNPEKQLPVETKNSDNNEIFNAFQDLLDKNQDKIHQTDDLMDIDPEYEEEVKKIKKKPILKAKRRVLETSILNKSLTEKCIKIKKNRLDNFSNERLEDAPSLNTRFQKNQYKLNSAMTESDWDEL